MVDESKKDTEVEKDKTESEQTDTGKPSSKQVEDEKGNIMYLIVNQKTGIFS